MGDREIIPSEYLRKRVGHGGHHVNRILVSRETKTVTQNTGCEDDCEEVIELQRTRPKAF